jgi:probable rRNA maturation factor
MEGWSVVIADETGTLDASLLGVLEKAAIATLQAEASGDIELSIALVGDAEIARMNREFLSHEGPADVISFPLTQPGLPVVGDIYIGVDQARRQAGEFGATFDDELIRLVVHGTLHVLGWNHPEGDDRSVSPMYRRQEEIVENVRR